jgi:uncharacterized membrane protein YqgA involved in biofilm formation
MPANRSVAAGLTRGDRQVFAGTILEMFLCVVLQGAYGIGLK